MKNLNFTRGVFVGINKYKKRKPYDGMDLRGCVNDRDAMIKAFKIKRKNRKILSNSRASSKNILKALKEMLEKLQVEETGVFYYSGHGTQYPDFDNEESDGLDEALCCYKTMYGDILLDDTIRHYINEYKKEGTTLLLIYDCCHSGTQAMSVPNWVTKYDGIPKVATLDSKVVTLDPEVVKVNRSAKALLKGNANGVIVWSGCEDAQYSYEVKMNGEFRGLFTTSIEERIRDIKKGKITLQEVHEAAVERIKKIGYNQTPQLTK